GQSLIRPLDRLPFRNAAGLLYGGGWPGSAELHRRAAGRHHEHLAVVAAQRLVIQVEADDGIGAKGFRLVGHALQRQRLGPAQLLLVAARAAAEDVGDAGEEVAEDVGAHHGLAADDAQIGGDLPAFDAVGAGDDHAGSSRWRSGLPRKGKLPALISPWGTGTPGPWHRSFPTAPRTAAASCWPWRCSPPPSACRCPRPMQRRRRPRGWPRKTARTSSGWPAISTK